MSAPTSPRPLKRDHVTFQLQQSHESQHQTQDLEEPGSVPADFLVRPAAQEQPKQSQESLPTPPILEGSKKRQGSVVRSETGSLTDAASATPSRDPSPAPAAPSQAVFPRTMGPASSPLGDPAATGSTFAATTSQPPAKKPKMSFQEKDLKRINKEIRDRERAEEKLRKEAEKLKKEAEKQALAEEKARKEAEKEAEKKRKEAEKAEKKAAQEAERAAKEEKRKQKEEEKKKKDKGQMKLGNFFNIPANPKTRASSVESHGRTSMSPAPQSGDLSAASVEIPYKTPSKPEKTPYEKMFLDFFVQDGVTLAPANRFKRDEEGIGAIEKTIDAYISGHRSPGRQRTFDAASLFHLPLNVPRGRRCMPVREIMSRSYAAGSSAKPMDLTTDSQTSQINKTRDLLSKVPLKFLKFQEDVRPPYRGTYTSWPIHGMTKLARNPFRRDLPDTNYDYDSEAEWVEDEDAEDLKSEDEEEEADDDDEDMDKFLDDENDEITSSRRLVVQGDLEPVSTGLCWEDRKRQNSHVEMMPYRMEIIIDPTLRSIDPFSAAYWAPPVMQTTSMEPPRHPLKSLSLDITMNSVASPKPVKFFFAHAPEVTLKPDAPSSTAVPSARGPKPKDAQDARPKKMVPDEDLPAFREAVAGSDLSKVGLIEVLKKKFPGRPAAAIKGTLETVAMRVGQKEVDKRWVLV
ncbi:uncharacterized protein L3040_002681 [Drepanopeziza brunnea f. sp. 'multigermtubi']|uniref:Chromatin assembly factor 1 subunit A n=1 Tax=Marssonina brunnea f. sp. multigermtubi (strain MB_m1) TaxID=1072389 RepID=K1WP32_MARBU|nr:chromatin assembly factor 1 subunit A [Drepanopeziza brunnea f. sp. 'multigermtubi' MB_m1]EKD19440.1 chromatin assembly factor 1 subunit A [Drepanopeziza brunnea f. sp. 'multigermtubi' MB_m1]KAJ5050812.1 hypothetical protein L3040_002681 [Drepanopeziza brunnea f. sp. 'multigermtubi']